MIPPNIVASLPAKWVPLYSSRLDSFFECFKSTRAISYWVSFGWLGFGLELHKFLWQLQHSKKIFFVATTRWYDVF